MTTLPITRTINETSFALAYMDATALVLDAVSLTGSARKEKLHFAKQRVQTALIYTDIPEEQALGRQLTALLRLYEVKGWDV